MSRNDNDDKLKIIGHRGARGLAPENTLASVQAALENGVDMIEIDVYVSLDGALLLNHDPHYRDPDNHKVKIHDTTHEDMKAHRANVTVLEEAIERIDHRVPLIIEIKPGVNTDAVCNAVKTYYDKGWTYDELRFCSFSPKVLRRIKQHFPEAFIIVNDDYSSIRAVYNAKRLGTTHISMYSKWLWSGVIRGITKRGFTLYSYTVDNPRLAARWHRAGLDAVYTDHPEYYRQAG